MKTTTARKERNLVAQVELMLAGPASEVYQGMSEDRKKQYHEGKRILVIDDRKSTCERRKEELQLLYPREKKNTVEYETNPFKAYAKIAAAQEAGKAYDVIVLDLYMKQMQGQQLMKKLHQDGILPAVVVDTASMMDPVVSDTVKQFDQQRSKAQMEEWFTANKTELKRPILFHDKFDKDSASLSAMIDVAMRVKQEGAGDSKQFLDEFEPMLLAATFSREVTHKIVEETGNAVTTVNRTLDFLKTNVDGFTETKWWKTSGARLTKSLEKLGERTFTNTYSDVPGKTGENLHEIANQMVDVLPPDPDKLAAHGFEDLADDARVKKAVQLWGEVLKVPYTEISALQKAYKEYHQPELNLPNFIQNTVGAGLELDSPPDFVVKGDRLRLAELITIPVEAGAKRAAESGSKLKVSVRETKSAQSDDLLDAGEKTRVGADCSRVCVIEITDTATPPKRSEDAYPEGFTNKLLSFERDGLGTWYVSKEKGLTFRLILNMDAGKKAAKALLGEAGETAAGVAEQTKTEPVEQAKAEPGQQQKPQPQHGK